MTQKEFQDALNKNLEKTYIKIDAVLNKYEKDKKALLDSKKQR